jgi:ribosomal protein S12 methylthiotransferase accessory factor
MEITFDGGKIVTAHHRGFQITTDQPVNNGGTGSAPSPFDLYLAAIGTCAAVYVKAFCDNRQLSTEGIKVIQKTTFSQESGLPIKLVIDIQLPEGFPEKYRQSIINVAELCKVKKSIASPPLFEITSSSK